MPISVPGAPLRDGTGRAVGAVEAFPDNSRVAAMTAPNNELRRIALLDPLTEVGNRRFLEQRLAARLDEPERCGRRVDVKLADNDGFEQVNDRDDHVVGDRVNRTVARRADRLMLAGKTAGRNRVVVGLPPKPG